MATPDRRPNTTTLLPLDQYDRVIVSFSGGKDSLACLLHLLDLGVAKDKLELWHQAVDGKGSRLMDWPVTEAYCTAVATALCVPIRFQWREGGFEREMLRNNTPTAPVRFEVGAGEDTAGGKGPNGTRLKFPQVSADLSVRWCSAYLKIDVARRAVSNDPRFAGTCRVLYISGERRQESAARSRYAEMERHPTSNSTRRVDHWRPVIDWSEQAVWDIIRKYNLRPHPAYYLGWGRVSCALCIFGDPDQWASARALLPQAFDKVAGYEQQFGMTIQRGKTVNQLADAGRSFLPADEATKALALGETYPVEMVVLAEGEPWQMPAGAFKRAGGPV